MAEAAFKEKLSAILGPDLAGYSCLTGEDEVATLHSLAIFDIATIDYPKDCFPIIAHLGKIFEIERRLL